ncbi:regulatory protein suaprga1 [Rhodotorula toruloides]|uniref:Regulatory protein suaprga1 n=1 Tax=Rhodotorula toruloides TaxID=5286 RepID=A0A511KBB8_RHOTO|nr:regulatory protein suaprga1 [Rhodotorula toruloides]
MLTRCIARSATAATRLALARAPTKLARVAGAVQSPRAFSTSLLRFSNESLGAKLAEEIKFEKESNDPYTDPEFLTAFKEEGVWKVEDKDGADEIVLSRTFGGENIRIIFSISDLDADTDIPAEAYDEEAGADSGSGGLGDEAATNEAPGLAIETSVTITKQAGGAVTIDAVAQDGMFTINNISFYPDADLALGMSSEDDWRRQGLYMGPAFDNLDEGVQTEFEEYLEERGINSSLALLIPDLAEWKEQKEYVRWLEGIKGFLQK